jgi:hypothetical protein
VRRRTNPGRGHDEVLVEGSPSLAVAAEDSEALEDLVAELLMNALAQDESTAAP